MPFRKVASSTSAYWSCIHLFCLKSGLNRAGIAWVWFLEPESWRRPCVIWISVLIFTCQGCRGDFVFHFHWFSVGLHWFVGRIYGICERIILIVINSSILSWPTNESWFVKYLNFNYDFVTFSVGTHHQYSLDPSPWPRDWSGSSSGSGILIETSDHPFLMASPAEILFLQLYFNFHLIVRTPFQARAICRTGLLIRRSLAGYLGSFLH